MDYQQALSYLSELTKFGINLGLGRIEELLRRLGQPQRRLAIAHIGGTNGKGSTGALLARMLQQAGYSVGLFTSPHLHAYTERFRINGREIPADKLAALLTLMRPHLDQMVAAGYEQPTEFEVSTALAFLYFQREQVDLLVLEVGLGGALDSTNVVQPLATVLTNVSLDHQAYLGDSVAAIAKVKCGIIKPGTPVVTAATGEALAIIAAVCAQKKAPLIICHAASDPEAALAALPATNGSVRELTWRRLVSEPTGHRFTVTGVTGVYEDLWLPLLGEHQLANATLALATAEVLTQRGFKLNPAELRQGLAATRWPGRLELIAGNVPVLLDGAHNHAGAQSLRRSLRLHFPRKKLILVLGILADKDQEKIVAELTPSASLVIITRPDHPRAGDWRDLGELAVKYAAQVYLKEKVTEALTAAFAAAGPSDLICVTGSLYLVAEAREILLGNTFKLVMDGR